MPLPEVTAMNKIKNITKKQLFLPIFSMILVMLINVLFDVLDGKSAMDFFAVSIKNGVLYGRIIDILNRGSEIAILALGMTLVVSASAGTDISVGSVMSLAGGVCCVMIAGFGVTSVSTMADCANPIWVGVICGIVAAVIAGAFNGFLVAYMNIQPMVATLILWSAARALALLICNNMIVYVRMPEFKVFGSFVGPVPTPIIIAAVCILAMSLILKFTAIGTYIQSVGINKKASRIAGLSSANIILLCYTICGLFAGIAGITETSRIYSADTNNIGLNLEMDAILAVALGGNSLGGGKFNLTGSIIGAYTIQAITTTLLARGVSTAQAPVFKAIIIILIVVIQAPPVKEFFKKRSAKKSAVKEVA